MPNDRQNEGSAPRVDVDVDAEIRLHWTRVCEDFPNATTPQVSRKVAEDFAIPVTRVFEAFGRGDSENPAPFLGG